MKPMMRRWGACVLPLVACQLAVISIMFIVSTVRDMPTDASMIQIDYLSAVVAVSFLFSSMVVLSHAEFPDNKWRNIAYGCWLGTQIGSLCFLLFDFSFRFRLLSLLCAISSDALLFGVYLWYAKCVEGSCSEDTSADAAEDTPV